MNQIVDQYHNWIKLNVLDKYPNNGYGRCREVSELMQKAFPKLRIAKGLFHDLMWGQREHFWLEDDENELIVDPTGLQHPTGSLIVKFSDANDWEELTDEEIPYRVPTGKCMECGEDVYQEKTFCNKKCYAVFAKSLEKII